ncbi:hypothetical protein [Leadbetterella sp. DM7]|uniref:hypothetical protein n=1 Tax=Leadbetterella sp. DM7 TaxID=3235085 RepID=UPI00349EC08D
MNTYRVTINTHFRFLLSTLLYVVIPVIIGVPLILYLKRGSFDIDIAYSIGVWGVLLLFIPKLLIHLNYYFENKNMVVYYEEAKKQLRVADTKRDVTFTMQDITKVTEYKTYPKAENRTTWMPWDDYHYSLVELRNGEKFYFTSLILPNLDLPIDKSKITLKKRFYPAIW